MKHYDSMYDVIYDIKRIIKDNRELSILKRMHWYFLMIQCEYYESFGECHFESNSSRCDWRTCPKGS